QRVCYARSQRTLLVSTHGIYHAHCELPPEVHGKFMTARSMGQFYGRIISGNLTFQCRSDR
ncbi:MAG: KTSC domain-containing protein, partial [Proteobacteria bacterium]|nr:KTSC domain-containing protein [Pseudomonadota bacterium]